MEQNGVYIVGYREEILAPKFTAADLSAIKQPLIKSEEVPDICLSIRTATARATGGQGYTKCQCTTQCTSGRCSCLRKKIKCNSRCHPGRSCKNLWLDSTEPWDRLTYFTFTDIALIMFVFNLTNWNSLNVSTLTNLAFYINLLYLYWCCIDYVCI